MERERDNFDGLRLLGALCVLVEHQSGLQGFYLPFSICGMGPGTLAVAMFFGTSGYLISASWHSDPSFWRFLCKRFFRIWPGLAFVILSLDIGCRVFVPSDPMALVTRPIAADMFLQNLAFSYWDSQFFPGHINYFLDGPLWTISYEVKCYLGLASIYAVAKGYGRWLLIPVAFGSAYLDEPLSYLVACFAIGALAHHWGLAKALPAAIIATALFLPSHPQAATRVLIVLPALWIGARSWPVLRSSARFGDLSYGIYLWSWPIQQVGVELFGQRAPWLILVSLPTTLGIAWLSWHLVEKRALFLKRFLRPRSLLELTTRRRGIA